MGIMRKIIRFIAVVGLSILLSLIFGGIYTSDLPDYDDFRQVSYIVENLYVMFNIGVAIYAYFKIFKE